MELKAHFSKIHQVIIDHLSQAHFEIVAAIAWFTDREIFDVLCTSARTGVKVSIVLIGDEINQGPGALNFQQLLSLGGQVCFLPPGSRDAPTMHHKFCVIDRATVITGSYNWSRKARSNDENITVVTGAKEFAAKYLASFDGLLDRSSGGSSVAADADATRRRLEMIRNLILLDEQEDLASQVRKLRPATEAFPVSGIIAALDSGQYALAIERIDSYLRRASALVVMGQSDVPRLRFQLEALELRLESLSDEKTELERRLITFNRRHDHALGNVIQRLLKARAELARLVAAASGHKRTSPDAQAAAEEAAAAYREYAKQHEDLQTAEPLPELDEAAERELKALYRKACSLCHPDKVSESAREAAHRSFVELQDAYKANDLARVRGVYESLVSGVALSTRSTTLSEVDALKAAIAELEFAIGRLVVELKSLLVSEAVMLMELAGSSEAEWQNFFEIKREELETELARVVSAILAEHTEPESP